MDTFMLDRTITIQAPPETVFSFFTSNERWATWWGAGSTIDAKPGGRVYIKHPGNVEVSGEVVEINPPRHLVFTYGYDSGTPFPSGGSCVTIVLEAVGAATKLHLSHEFPEPVSRDEHVQGWRFQLSLFANAVANVVHAGVTAKVDAWFGLWAEHDAARRAATLDQIASSAVSFRDRYSMVDGHDDLSAHVAASQRFMPGIVLQRRGDVRQCQGTAVADWAAVGPNNVEIGKGSNVFLLGPDGKIASVTGLWG